MKKIRVDQALVARGLCESREKAQRLIIGGKVLIDGRPARKPGQLMDEHADLSVAEGERYVSRGGEKLEAALRHWQIRPEGWVCLDIGASTGGFTDCLLQHGAARVYAVDVGRGLLHPRLQKDPRVTALEGVNARYLTPADLPERPSLIVVDASFISLGLLLPPLAALLETGAQIITLIKPQFEVGPTEVMRGGVVRDPAARARAIERVRAAGEACGLAWQGVIESPLKGPAGNVEYLALWKKR